MAWRPDARRVRVGEHGLEADAEAADLLVVLGLGAFANVGNAPYVLFVECPSVVLEDQFVRRKDEGYLRRLRVLGVLKQLVDEMRGVGVQVLDDPPNAGMVLQDASQILSVPANPLNHAHVAVLQVILRIPSTTRVA